MNRLQEKLSISLKNKKVKGAIIGTSLLLLGALNLPTGNGLRERYIEQKKIQKLPKYEHNIQQLFEQLGYNDRANTLRMNDTNDVDLGHLKGSQETMENLLRQFYSLQETNEKKIISIPGCWTRFHDFHRETVTLYLQASYDCEVLRDIQDRFGLSEDETIFILSALMHWALSEHTEEQQEKNWTVQHTTASGNNSVDFRGNIAGVIVTLEDKKKCDINISDIQRILYDLQKEYHSKDAQSILRELSQDFYLQVQIVDKK